MEIITIQDSFQEIIAEVRKGVVGFESFWLALRNSTTDQLRNYTVTATLDESKNVIFNTVAENDGQLVTFTAASARNFNVALKGEESTETLHLLTPKYRRAFPGKGTITAAEFANGNGVFLGSSNGTIYVYDTICKETTHEWQAHYLDVTHIRLLPSGKVLLTVGNDFRVNLWDLSERSKVPTKTFLKQKKRITDLAVIGRGRNFLTSSEDGTVAVWECASQSVVTTYRQASSLSDSANCIALTVSATEPEENQFRSDFLFECRQQVLFVGYQLGLIQQYSVARNCATSIKYSREAPVTSITTLAKYVIAGFSDGYVLVWDWFSDRQYSLVLDRNHSIEHIRVTSEHKVEFQLSNGPENLMLIHFNEETNEITKTYLIGFKEMFRVQVTGACVATKEEFGLF